MKKVVRLFLIVLGSVVVVFIGILLFSTGHYNIEINTTEFELQATMEMPLSYDTKNGSDWGHNQEKLASIGDVTFTFDFDNENIINGNSSDTNPYYSHFVYIVDGMKTEFDVHECNRPGNVLADPIHNKVYYLLVEPSGIANNDGYDFSSFAKTVMYEYDFEPNARTLTLVETHDVTPVSSDGKIRQGADIDEEGNIAIAYGRYTGEMMVYVYEYTTRMFTEYSYQSNASGDSLMYANVVIKDKDHVYFIAEQDTTREDKTYYQYVMFFAVENGVWSSEMVVDYRDSEYALTHESIVLNSDIELVDGVIHLAATSLVANEVTYKTYQDGELLDMDASYLPSGTGNVKFVVINDTLYIATMNYTLQGVLPRFNLVNTETEEVVYTLFSVVNNRYFYVDVMEDDTLSLLIYSDRIGLLYEIK